MGSEVPTVVESLFGSRTRAMVLGYLAESSTPPTGYAIAKALSIGASKVYPELKKLQAIGILEGRLDVRGGKTYLLKDDDLRRFLLKRSRIMFSKDWFSSDRLAQRRKDFERAREIQVRVPPAGPARARRPFEREFRRPRAKDRAVARIRRRSGVAP